MQVLGDRRCFALVPGGVCGQAATGGGLCEDHQSAPAPDVEEPASNGYRERAAPLESTSDGAAGRPLADVRGQIRDEAEASVEAIRELLREALKTDKVVHAKCPKCATAVPHVVGDWSARLRALELMLDQGFGRPAVEVSGPGLSAGAARVKAELEAMSDEELLEMIAAETASG
jgi:hypothetical protein